MANAGNLLESFTTNGHPEPKPAVRNEASKNRRDRHSNVERSRQQGILTVRLSRMGNRYGDNRLAPPVRARAPCRGDDLGHAMALDGDENRVALVVHGFPCGCAVQVKENAKPAVEIRD